MRRLLPAFLLLSSIGMAQTPPSGQPIPIKVVVVTMFELGEDTGDRPGEFQFWVEREHLDRQLPLPAGNRPLRMNSDGVLGVVTGMGTAKAAATIMALGLDPRFDLSHAYWLIAGIGGGDPADTSLGSAVWAEWVIDGDIGYEIDAREIPATWTTGFIPLRKSVPYEQPAAADDGQAYHLNPAMVEWAWQLTRDTPLADNDAIRARRLQFAQAAAHRPPFVLKGDDLCASTFWHGAKLDAWANEWVRYYTGGKGNFVTTAMEDTGTLQSLTFLARAGRVDLDRVLVLRSISNYDQQRPGVSASDSLVEQRVSRYSAYLPSLESAYAVGHVVVDALVAGWPRYRDRLPSQPAATAATAADK